MTMRRLAGLTPGQPPDLLLCQPDAPQQVGEARVGAQAVSGATLRFVMPLERSWRKRCELSGAETCSASYSRQMAIGAARYFRCIRLVAI